MIQLDTIELPDLVIEDEFAFTGVEARVDRSLGGAPIIWEQEIAGRPIDLTGDERSAWITRDTLEDLKTLAAVPGATYTLTYESDTYTVRFRHEEPPAIMADPLVPRPNHADGDYYKNVRLKLMEI